MSTIANNVGLVFVLPHRGAGRRRNLGSLAFVEGYQVICLGYTKDGENVVYARVSQLKEIRRLVGKVEKSFTYRLLKRLLARYEA